MPRRIYLGEMAATAVRTRMRRRAFAVAGGPMFAAGAAVGLVVGRWLS